MDTDVRQIRFSTSLCKHIFRRNVTEAEYLDLALLPLSPMSRMLSPQVGVYKQFDSGSSVYPMSCQLQDIGCTTEDQLSKS